MHHISDTGLSSQQCARYYEQIKIVRTGTANFKYCWEVKLKEEMERGQKFKNQLFKACEESNISPKQLQLLGHTQTSAQLRTPGEKKSEVQQCRGMQRGSSQRQKELLPRAKEGHTEQTVQRKKKNRRKKKKINSHRFPFRQGGEAHETPAALPSSEDERKNTSNNNSRKKDTDTTPPKPSTSSSPEATNPLKDRIRPQKDFLLPIRKSLRESPKK